MDETKNELIFQMVKNNGYLMDAYTLPRLFRNFTIPGTDIETTKKIVYAGSFHTNDYVEFFEKELGVKVKKYGEENYYFKQCIDMDVQDYLWMLD